MERLEGVAVPIRLWYPNALGSDQPDAIDKMTEEIPALVRQAREFYRAANSSEVTDVSRPVLQFYAAEALANAIAHSVFTTTEVYKSHGLEAAQCPEVVTLHMNKAGVFPALYKAVRADLLSCQHPRFLGSKRPRRKDAPNPKVHVDDCLASLGYAGSKFVEGVVPLAQSRDSSEPEVLLLPTLIVQYLVLFYFSIMARYHTVAWQRLLRGDDARSLPIRTALASLPRAFVIEAANYLPTSVPSYMLTYGQRELQWTEKWTLDDWSQPSGLDEQSDQTVRLRFAQFDEWMPPREA